MTSHILYQHFNDRSKKLMHSVNTFRSSNGPPKFCIELEADWLIVLDEARTKSPGTYSCYKHY